MEWRACRTLLLCFILNVIVPVDRCYLWPDRFSLANKFSNGYRQKTQIQKRAKELETIENGKTFVNVYQLLSILWGLIWCKKFVHPCQPSAPSCNEKTPLQFFFSSQIQNNSLFQFSNKNMQVGKSVKLKLPTNRWTRARVSNLKQKGAGVVAGFQSNQTESIEKPRSEIRHDWNKTLHSCHPFFGSEWTHLD